MAPGAKCSTSVAATQVEPGMRPISIVCISCGAPVINSSKRPDAPFGASPFECDAEPQRRFVFLILCRGGRGEEN